MMNIEIKSSFQTRVIFDFHQIQNIDDELNSIEQIVLNLPIKYKRKCEQSDNEIAPFWKNGKNLNCIIDVEKIEKLMECCQRLKRIFEAKIENDNIQKKPKAKEQYLDLSKCGKICYPLALKEKKLQNIYEKKNKKVKK